MSALNQIQFGFENLLKIGFEKLEKEKEKRNQLHSEFRPVLSAAQRARPTFPSPAPAFSRVGRAQAAACWPSSRAQSL
jgi:hypothetical protein